MLQRAIGRRYLGREVAVPGCGARRMRLVRVEYAGGDVYVKLVSVHGPFVACTHTLPRGTHVLVVAL